MDTSSFMFFQILDAPHIYCDPELEPLSNFRMHCKLKHVATQLFETSAQL